MFDFSGLFLLLFNFLGTIFKAIFGAAWPLCLVLALSLPVLGCTITFKAVPTETKIVHVEATGLLNADVAAYDIFFEGKLKWPWGQLPDPDG